MLGNIGWAQILILLVIVILVFGTKRLRSLGSDLGSAIRDFRKGVKESDEEAPQLKADPHASERTNETHKTDARS